MNIAQVTYSDHFIKQAKAKGFTASQIIGALMSPEKITDVRKYPGQKRYCGSGVAVVMDGTRAITIYLDGVVTPMREDQKNDPSALNSRRLNRR